MDHEARSKDYKEFLAKTTKKFQKTQRDYCLNTNLSDLGFCLSVFCVK